MRRNDFGFNDGEWVHEAFAATRAAELLRLLALQ